MDSHLIIDGNAVYEIDEDCLRKIERQKREQNEKSHSRMPGSKGRTKSGSGISKGS